MLGDDITAVLPQLRAEAESLQTDTCTITRPGEGQGTFDPGTGTTTPPAATEVYAGQCRFRAPSLTEVNTTAGEHQWTTQDLVLSLPATAVGPRPDDTVVCDTSALDPALAGATFVVVAALKGSQITARRLIVREVTS